MAFFACEIIFFVSIINMELEIVYQDEFFVAINKPHGLLVHRTKLALDADVFALQLLRNQLGQKVSPCHRIDRKTSGVLLFALDDEADRLMKALFANGETLKTYLSIVRGFTEPEGVIDYALKKENGNSQEAITEYKTLQQVEIDLPQGKHPTSRYSLVEAYPKTGRMHQIRKHFAHIHHPIIGDRPHGCNKQNKLFKEKWDMDSMMLHADLLAFVHPFTNKEIQIRANLSSEFMRVKSLLGLD